MTQAPHPPAGAPVDRPLAKGALASRIGEAATPTISRRKGQARV